MQVVDDNGKPIREEQSKRIIAGVLAIIFGALGVHKFVLGYMGEGLIMLVLTLITCGIGGWFMGLIGFIEGIIYLTKTDKEFVHLYQANKRSWF